jgi:tetratricopeptide (TPR) repeat protein
MYSRFVAAAILLIVAMGCVQQPSQTVSTVSPEESLEILRKGAELHDQQKYAEAIAVYKNLLLRDPNNAQALYEMAYSYAASHSPTLKTIVITRNRRLLPGYYCKQNVTLLQGQLLLSVIVSRELKWPTL